MERKLSTSQLELLQSLQYFRTEEDLADFRSLLQLYLDWKLTRLIEEEEEKRGYTRETYEMWLHMKRIPSNQ